MKNGSKYCVAALMAFLTLPVLTAAEEGTSSRFSDEEIEKLKDGKLVMRPHPKSGTGSLIGGTSFILVNAPPQDVFEQFGEVESWTEVFPHTYESKAVARKGDAVAVKLRVGVPLIQAGLYLTMLKKPKELAAVFSLNKSQKSGIVSDVNATIRFVPQPGSRTLVICSIMTRTAFSAFVALLGDQAVQDLERNLLSIPKKLKKWVEETKVEKTPVPHFASR